MLRICVIVEGKTEHIFVKKILSKYLLEKSNNKIILFSIQNETSKWHKGGVVNYQRFIKNIVTQANTDKDTKITTLIDYYGLAKIKMTNYEEVINSTNDVYNKVQKLEELIKNDVTSENIMSDRFIPYIQLHEFEALFFADYERFLCIDKRWNDNQKKEMTSIASTNHPELINNGADTPPSKRLAKILCYGKTYHTELFAQYLEDNELIIDSINTMRRKCPHFNEWLTKLESLNTSSI